MNLHSRIVKIYNEKFLKSAGKHWLKLLELVNEGNNFNNPDIGTQSNFANKLKYFNPDYAIRVADKLNKILKGTIDGPKKLNILDVGCGFGNYSIIFKEFGHNVHGVLGGNWYIKDYEYILNQLNIRYSIIDILKLSETLVGFEFDIVWCAEILTLPSLQPLIKPITHQLLEVVRPTGRIIVLNHSNKAISPTLEVYN